MYIKISHGYLRKFINTLNHTWTLYCCIRSLYCKRSHLAGDWIEFWLSRVPTLNRSSIYLQTMPWSLSAYLKLSGAPGTWLLRLHLVYIQTSGSSDMPYMICDVLVVFLERYIPSYVLWLFFFRIIASSLHYLSILFRPRRICNYYPYDVFVALHSSLMRFKLTLPYSEPNVTR